MTLLVTVGLLALSFVTLSTSTLAYAGIYNLYVPTAVHQLPVFFNYAQGLTSSKFPEHPSPPTAIINLLAKDKQWSHHESRLHLMSITYAEAPFLLTTEVEYDVNLELDIPRSRRNLDVGSFMVKLEILADHRQVRELFDADKLSPEEVKQCTNVGEDYQSCLKEVHEHTRVDEEYLYKDIGSKRFDTIASSARPVTLTHPPLLSAVFELFLSIIPSFLGGASSEHVTLPMIEKFREHPYIRAARIRIILSDFVQISRASLHLKTKLRGLRYMMYHWSFTTAMVGITALFVVQTLAAIAIVYALWLQCARVEFPELNSDSGTFSDTNGFVTPSRDLSLTSRDPSLLAEETDTGLSDSKLRSEASTTGSIAGLPSRGSTILEDKDDHDINDEPDLIRRDSTSAGGIDESMTSRAKEQAGKRA
eukprot:CAMPEP_0184492336 /NCGR_PEP_ID=MMETSP0113_2-20130426/22903_1 /TAXON_ID=91329 /ORGANISM="Norrisiella sphaerica, Strain BC52" /LENGTH=420 /DNA_ID=CAMNT_0026877065 /DNA_START=21 /DNA_END=1280 /DNA_ORIENTATION=+